MFIQTETFILPLPPRLLSDAFGVVVVRVNESIEMCEVSLSHCVFSLFARKFLWFRNFTASGMKCFEALNSSKHETWEICLVKLHKKYEMTSTLVLHLACFSHLVDVLRIIGSGLGLLHFSHVTSKAGYRRLVSWLSREKNYAARELHTHVLQIRTIFSFCEKIPLIS